MSFVERIVVDTVISISAALHPASSPAQAVALALARDPHRSRLHLWRGIPILNPAAFVAALSAQR